MTLIFSNGLPRSIGICFPKLKNLEIATEEVFCSCCEIKQRLQSQWSHAQSPKTFLLGNVDIRVIIKRCPQSKKAYYPEQYQKLIPFNGIYGYDIIIKVGMLRYIELLQDIKIQEQILIEENIFIPLSTIGHLSKKYIDYISSIHYSNAGLLKKYFESNGLVLTQDGTYEGDTGIHFSMRDSVTGIVLYNMKIKTENERDIAKGIEECIKYFGKPVAVVCDLSTNIRNAVKSVLKDTPLLICHFHFLENIGEALLGKTRKELVKIIKDSKIISYLSKKRRSITQVIKKYQDDNNIISNKEELEFNRFINGDLNAKIAKEQKKRYIALAQLNWIADYKYELNGEYFPFSIKEVAFVNKCIEAVSNFKKIFSKNAEAKNFDPIYSAYKRLKEFVRQNKLKATLKKIKLANDIFNQTRDFFRLNSSKNSPVSRVKSTTNNNAIINDFKTKMKDFEVELKVRQENCDIKEFSETVLKYIDKYRDNLTGHVLIHEYNDNKVLINIPRTNNIMETLFGSFKRKIRKRIGCKKLTNHFKAMHQDEFLIENLTNQTYINIMLDGSVNNLVEMFPQFDKQAFLTSLKRKENNGSFTLKKSILRDKQFSINIIIALKALSKIA